MWMHHPSRGILSKEIEANNFKKPDEIEFFKQQGWKEIRPMWIKHPDTEVVWYITHPAHMRRLIREEGGVQVEAPKDAPKELVSAK